jgi:DNA-binding CsgD family transcriptional regulator
LAIEKLLTPREAEIARFVAAGLSNKQIARKASIAEGTVKIHLHRAYQKLGIANRAALAVFMFGSDAGARDQRRWWGSPSFGQGRHHCLGRILILLGHVPIIRWLIGAAP